MLIQRIPALTFLPFKNISTAFNELKINMPVKACEIIKWFENYYIYDRIRHILRNRNVVRFVPLFLSLL